MTKQIFNFRVTDHVLLRYMERMLGVDVDAFRERLRVQLEPAAKAGVKSIETAGMVFKFSYGSHDCVVSTMWLADGLGGKKRPPDGRDLSLEAKHIKARKRMGK
jgi:hypothetical protein